MSAVVGVVPVKDIKLGTQVYDIFEATGVSSNEATFESVLGVATDSSPEHITGVTSHMKINVSARVYALLVKSSIKSKRIDRALQFVKAMREAGARAGL